MNRRSPDDVCCPVLVFPSCYIIYVKKNSSALFVSLLFIPYHVMHIFRKIKYDCSFMTLAI